MSLHKSEKHNTPAIVAAMKAHGLDVEAPSQLSDAFRLGYLAAAPGWTPQRCAECDCTFGQADCNWIKTPPIGEYKSA